MEAGATYALYRAGGKPGCNPSQSFCRVGQHGSLSTGVLMPSAKRPSRSALVALAGEIDRDTNLSLEVRSRLTWGLNWERKRNPGMDILEEEVRAAVWRILWGLQSGDRDLLTRCRAFSELIRGLRTLGILHRNGTFGPGGSRSWR
jgi:hypothetical protein